MKNDQGLDFVGLWIPKEIMDLPDVSCFEILILSVILTFSQGKNKHCWASNATIARNAKVDEKTVTRTVTKYTNTGLLKCTYDKNNVRRITLPYGLPVHTLSPASPYPMDSQSTNTNIYTNIDLSLSIKFESLPISDKLKRAFNRWDTFLKSKYGKNFDEAQAESWLLAWSYLSDQEKISSIDWSIANGFRNIRENKKDLPKNGKLSTTDRSLQALKEVLEISKERL